VLYDYEDSHILLPRREGIHNPWQHEAEDEDEAMAVQLLGHAMSV
jgi:hypothetical protein